MRFRIIGWMEIWARFHLKLIVLCSLCHCALTVEIENSTKTQIPNKVEIQQKTTACGDTQKMVDKCFKDLPPHLMEFLTTQKIAVDGDEMKSKCTVFDRGMECFNEYTKRCLSKKKLDIFKNNVEGARNFFIKFCKDPVFQEDYLRHRECFSHIQDDWVRCTHSFHNILSNELHEARTNVTNKFMEFCCARYAFEKCIYNSARYKCYKNSASFARETAKMLSDEKHFSNCRQYAALCTSNNVKSLWHDRVGDVLGLCVFVLVLTRPKSF